MKTIENLREIYAEYGLDEEDYYAMERRSKDGRTNKINIITRSGVEKIEMKANLAVLLDLAWTSADGKSVVIQATTTAKNGVTITSFGEASPSNIKVPYPFAMAEKRARGRVVLKAVGLYSEHVYTEDEFDGEQKFDEYTFDRLMATSSFDPDQQQHMRLRFANLENIGEYRDLIAELAANQLAHHEVPGTRDGAADIQRRLDSHV